MGGISVGDGSDGCVFDKKFDDQGNPTAVEGTATKVYPKNKSNLADAELQLSNTVYNVVPKDANGFPIAAVIGHDLKVIPTVNDTIKHGSGACGELKADIGSRQTDFKALEMPLIIGDIVHENKGKENSSSEFDKYEFYSVMIKTIESLVQNKLFHADIADRNIFEMYDPRYARFKIVGSGYTHAALGDFGNMINLNDTVRLNENITYYCESHNITTESHLSRVFMKDGSTPMANICMAMFMISIKAPEKLPEKIEYIKSIVVKKGDRYPFEDISFILNGRTLAEVVHKDSMRKKTRSISDHYIPQMLSLLAYLSTIHTPEEYLEVAKLHMLDSDLKMLSVVMAHKDVEDDPRAFTAWNTFPALPVPRILPVLPAFLGGPAPLPAKYPVLPPPPERYPVLPAKYPVLPPPPELPKTSAFDPDAEIKEIEKRLAALRQGGRRRKTKKHRRSIKKKTRKFMK